MRKPILHKRPGITLIELTLYLALMGFVIGVTLPMLYRTASNRVLQQTISAVEQNATQVLESISLRTRNAERILMPPRGETGTVLMLQTADPDSNPVVIGTSTGRIIIVRHSTRETVSSTQVAVENFVVRNTSVSDDKPSLSFSFDVSRTIRLQQPYSYTKHYEASISLFPDDISDLPTSCGCPITNGCDTPTSLVWGVCLETCYVAETEIDCEE